MSRADRLVGRGHALQVLRSALGDASGGTQFVLVTGEAGIGKSALLGAFADEAARSCTVLRAFCWDGSGVPPYWPWSQVLRATGLPAGELGEAGRLVGAAAPASGDAADDRFRLFDAVGRCLTPLASRRPVAVVIDDLHWADESSLDLLSFLARTLSASPVLLAGAYRDTEAPARLHEIAAAAQQVALPGLSAADVAAMVTAESGATPPVEVAEQLRQRTGGNPFFVRELARLLRAHGAGTQLPAGVIEAVRRRLARLSTDCVRLLDWAAVAGKEIDVDLLVAAGAAADKAVAHDLLDEARRAGVVAGSAFTHDLYRDAIRDALGASARIAINAAIAGALIARDSDPARIAEHLLAAGPDVRDEAVDYSLRAAREAAARLGHDEACAHYLRALDLLGVDDPRRLPALLDLAEAHARSGAPGASAAAMRRYREAADVASRCHDPVSYARAALGMQALGHRSGAHDPDVVETLSQAAARLPDRDEAALKSRVLAAVARARRHGSMSGPQDVVAIAERAVQLAVAADDQNAVAAAKLAVHDAMWTPGSASARLPVLAEMLAAATAAGDADLIAEAHVLRAAALLELGDPTGRDALREYVAFADSLGHARGRWRALTRRATLAQLAGRAEEAAELGERALELGRAIGEPDALGCFCTSRWSLVALGVREPDVALEAADPMWPMFPLVAAWPHAVRGDLDAARKALGDFSVLDVSMWTGLESLAVAAVVFAAVGSDEQRGWAYAQLLPHAGTHVVVGGCASYHAAVDHHLGALAAALGDAAAAERHFRAAVAMHDKVGAAAWQRLSEAALAALRVPADNEFRMVEGRWLLRFAGTSVSLADAKGLHDLRVVLQAGGGEVQARTLVGLPTDAGADRVLDATAMAAYRARLTQLDSAIEDAVDDGRADRLRAERSALVHELAAATGLGGRPRRLGDDGERARKTVSARVRDALAKIEAVHPQLAAHLRAAVRLGTTCRYAPAEPTQWRLS